MAENRRSINLWSSSRDSSEQDFDLTIRAMEEQIRLEGEIESAESERLLTLEKVRQEQELIGQETEDSLKSLQSEMADSSYSDAMERTSGQIAESRDAFDEMTSSSETFTASTGTGLKSLFRTIFRTELSSARDLWGTFCNSMVRTWSNTMAKLASKGFEELLGGLSNWWGGGEGVEESAGYLFHSGGIVGEGGAYKPVNPLLFAGAPRFHSGLAPDEFPAILQRGEAVIPRNKWTYADNSSSSREDRPLQVQVKLENQSSTALRLEEGTVSREFNKVVVAIVAKDLNENGPIRRMITSIKK